jgi:hypothetical protein
MTQPTNPVEVAEAGAESTVLDIAQIQRILPHRFPFLLIDRVISLTPRQKIVALKNVSANEPHFAGHFPGFPIMPGVLIVEAIAQAGGALLLTEIPDYNKLMVSTGIERPLPQPVVWRGSASVESCTQHRSPGAAVYRATSWFAGGGLPPVPRSPPRAPARRHRSFACHPSDCDR